VGQATSAVNVVRCETSGQVPDMLAALCELHQQRWQARGQPGCFGPGSAMRRFHEQFAPLARRRGWLRLYTLELDGVVRAVQYGLAYAGHFLQLQEGYDAGAPTGVGNVLREHVFRASIAEGLRGYDFLGEFTNALTPR